MVQVTSCFPGWGCPFDLHLTNELNWSSRAQQPISDSKRERQRRGAVATLLPLKPGHVVATHSHGFIQICQTLFPGLPPWPCSRRSDQEGRLGGF